MKLTWNGKDITDKVNITGCVYRDMAKERCDSLELEFEKAKVWYRWEPKTDDRITIEHEGIETKTMYFHYLFPETDHYRLIATSTPSMSRRQEWKSYEKKTLATLIGQCASECEMGFGLYGVAGGTFYDYAVRKYMGAAKYLQELGKREGFMVKAYDGKMRCVDIRWAQGQEVMRKLKIDDTQEQALYQYSSGGRIKTLTIKSPRGENTATDSGAKSNRNVVITDLPAKDNVEAGRWARNLLLYENRMTEKLTVSSVLDNRMTANAHILVEGNTDASGDWLADEVEHDLFNLRTKTTMLRCISTIG